MKIRHLSSVLTLACLLSFSVAAQTAGVTIATEVAILKAEDARRYDRTLENLLKHPNENVRVRSALAAGRIGNKAAVGPLIRMLNDSSGYVREMAAFALGEIESVDAAAAIISVLGNAPSQAETRPSGRVSDAKDGAGVRARLVEAAGKIAAANAKDAKAKELGRAIIGVLEGEAGKGVGQDQNVVRQALTAALRARPEGSDIVVAKFLTSADAKVRADAANTLSRLRAKNANERLRAMLGLDTDPIVRANAARALGAADDKDAVNVLIRAATSDTDARVRVSAIRSLGSLKNATAAAQLLSHGEKLFADYKRSTFRIPAEKNELIEIATVLGRLLADTRDARAAAFLRDLSRVDNGFTAEIPLARFRVSPGRGDDKDTVLTNWRQYSTLAQIVGEFATLETKNEAALKMKGEAPAILRPLAEAFAKADTAKEADTILAAPDVLREYAKFKTADLGEVLRTALSNKDIFIRATSAELIGELPESQANVNALRSALEYALVNDFHSDDAILAIIEVLFKLDPAGLRWRDVMLSAIGSPDYLVRKKILDLIPKIRVVLDSFPLDSLYGQPGDVRPYSGKGTKMGQVLNTDADYRRAASRKNGSVKAVLSTEKGTFTIDLLPDDAPLTVDNFIKLARANYFDGLEVHRVVPNFVMQDGDPRGDGNGGPGWSIRCEINMVPYERGAVGMALSGKDTGGSQWFVTHSPQPHLDGGYTVFGRVNERDMKVVDSIVRGDKVISVKIHESSPPPRRGGAERKND